MTPTRHAPPPAGETTVPIGLMVALLVAVVGVVAWISDVDLTGATPSFTTAAEAAPEEAAAELPAEGPAEEQAPTPVRVRIPVLEVDAPMQPLGLQEDRTLEVPEDPHVTGWWQGGARPGERGPAVVVGHVDSRSGPGVFVDLHRLQSGHRVIVDREDGTSVHYDVREVTEHPKDDFPTEDVYGATAAPTLRLVTCGGEFDRGARSYEDNIVVYLDLVGWS